MEQIDISKIASALRPIRGIPFLGRLLRCTVLSSKTAAIALSAISVAVLVAFAAFFLIIPPGNVPNGIIGVIAFASFLASLLLLFAAWGVSSLNKQLLQCSVGTYHDWINSFFGTRSRIPTRLPKGAWQRIWAICVCLLAGVLAVAGAGLLLLGGGGLLLGAIVLALHSATWRRFRRLTAIPSSEILATDQRAPILFLRSFRDDSIKLKSDFFSFHIGKASRFEEKIAIDFWREGPVVAIGKPGESLPQFGACREYHTDDTWKGRVLELVAKAKGVFMLIGLTEALGWEIHQLRDKHALKKSLFLMPPLLGRERAQRVQKFSAQLPEFASAMPIEQRDLGRIICIAFNADDRPIILMSRRRTTLDYGVAVHAAIVRCASNSRRN
jgi:hypothetical protein